MIRRRPDKKTILILAALAAFAGAVWLLKASRWDTADLHRPENLRFVDKNGRILRFVPDKNGCRHLDLPLSAIPDPVVHAFLAAEDERFFSHPGVDVPAVIRAMFQNLSAGRIVSGASTLTQQVSRMVYPRPRTVTAKLVEMARSLRMEGSLSKKRILEIYLNSVPMGNKIQGVGLASAIYFQKHISRLNPEEAALLAALPKAPGDLNPYGENRQKLKNRRDWVLDRMALLGHLTGQQAALAKAQPVKIAPFAFPFHAPHVVDALLEDPQRLGATGEIRLTLDLDIQTWVEHLLSAHKARLAAMGAGQAAVIVLSTPLAKVLAAAGSLDYGPENKGFNNGLLARRSAGSTLKPFVYALALESGFTASSLLADTSDVFQTPGGDYRPVNFNRARYGPVTLRAALGGSLNLPAVKMLQKVGQERFFRFLGQLGLAPARGPEAKHYGLGLVLGNMEVRLADLAGAYAALRNGGMYREVSWVAKPADPAHSVRVCGEATAHIIMDILADPTARSLTFGSADAMTYPFKVAVKTGTSNGYRDGWVIGTTPEFTVAVWAGNFDGAPTFGMSGAAGAAPILKDILLRLYKGSQPADIPLPPGVARAPVCGISGQAPGPYCQNLTYELFKTGTVPTTPCSFHRHHQIGHSLPPVFSQWVHDRRQRGAAGGFQLAGVTRPNLESPVTDGETGTPRPKTNPGNHHVISTPPPSFSPGSGMVVRITYPFSNDRFILNKSPQGPHPDVIRLQARTSRPAPYVDWYVDGHHLERVAPPYGTAWPLARGRHLITAFSPGFPGDCVEIFVE